MKKKVQLIGKVSFLNRGYVVAKFAHHQAALEAKGFEVWNPVVHVPEESTQVEAMRICLTNLLNPETTAVSIQPDWVDSEGGKVEYMVSHALGLEIVRV